LFLRAVHRSVHTATVLIGYGHQLTNPPFIFLSWTWMLNLMSYAVLYCRHWWWNMWAIPPTETRAHRPTMASATWTGRPLPLRPIRSVVEEFVEPGTGRAYEMMENKHHIQNVVFSLLFVSMVQCLNLEHPAAIGSIEHPIKISWDIIIRIKQSNICRATGAR
jgi:hypothetical protein